MSVFIDKIKQRWKDGARFCVGLDYDPVQIPCGMRPIDFFIEIIESTKKYALAYKPNLGYYELCWGLIDQLDQYLADHVPEVPHLSDGKRSDVRHTMQHYAHSQFGTRHFLAATTVPFFGMPSLEPFLAHQTKSLFVMCRESDDETHGSGEFTDLEVKVPDAECEQYGLPPDTWIKQYELIAYRARHRWNANGNCHVVVGADQYEALARVRRIIGEDMWVLCPGYGRQGADLKRALKAGLNSQKKGMIVSGSRTFAYAGGQASLNTGKRSCQVLTEATEQYRALEAAL